MHVRILSVCQKIPSWVETGYQDYLKRFSPGMRVESIDISPEKRGVRYVKEEVITKESERLLAVHHSKHHLVALDVQGEPWSTEELVRQMKRWMVENPHIDFLIGGADGLSPSCLKQANQRFSLSKLTFPHIFVKLLLIEQLYRGWSVIEGQPYHR